MIDPLLATVLVSATFGAGFFMGRLGREPASTPVSVFSLDTQTPTRVLGGLSCSSILTAHHGAELSADGQLVLLAPGETYTIRNNIYLDISDDQ